MASTSDPGQNTGTEIDIPPGTVGQNTGTEIDIPPGTVGQDTTITISPAPVPPTPLFPPGTVVQSTSPTISAGALAAPEIGQTSTSGIAGKGTNQPGVLAESQTGSALVAQSDSGNGIVSTVAGASAPLADFIDLSQPFSPSLRSGSVSAALAGHAIIASTSLPERAGLIAVSLQGAGVLAAGSTVGVQAHSQNGIGLHARSDQGVGLRVEGQVQIASPAVGQVQTKGGEKVLQVVAEAATEQSTILLTPLSNPGAFLWIAERRPKAFVIEASQPLPPQLSIQYLIIN